MKKRTNLSNLEDHIGYWIRCLSNFVHDSFAQKIKSYDISVEQWVVLRTLFDNEGATLQETAILVGVDNSSLSRMIERLVKRDLVIRTQHPSSRRTIILALSSTAKELVPLLAQEADKNDSEFFKTFTSSDKSLFIKTIKDLLLQNGWDKTVRGKDTMK